MRFSIQAAMLAIVAGATLTSAAHGAINPTVAAADAFIYNSTGPAGPPGVTGANSNFGNANYLGVSKDRDSARLVYSLIRFDTTGQTLAAGQTAKFQITSRTQTGTAFPPTFVAEPTATNSIVVDVYKVTQPWTESGAGSVTFENQPTVATTPFSFVVDAINKTYTVDITSLVQDWITSPATNYGLEIRQRATVIGPNDIDTAAIFNARNGTLGAVPLLVPEPTTLASIAGLATMTRRRRR